MREDLFGMVLLVGTLASFAYVMNLLSCYLSRKGKISLSAVLSMWTAVTLFLTLASIICIMVLMIKFEKTKYPYCNNPQAPPCAENILRI